MSGEDALMTVLISYGGCAFQVLAGLLGLALSNKKSIITVLLGILLFIPSSRTSSRPRATSPS